ncbi:MAG TPA: NAD(P)/FAD-dependent oxidoreductase, partial [Nocardioides sp.]|nr:NAD(P)/FAD-dependent oxidoreductase [Nocardioides sp.]
AITFVSNTRSERTTTEQQIFARAALARLRRGAADLVSDPGIYDATRAMMEETRRQELEASAAREAELTDSGVRGVPAERVGGA